LPDLVDVDYEEASMSVKTESIAAESRPSPVVIHGRITADRLSIVESFGHAELVGDAVQAGGGVDVSLRGGRRFVVEQRYRGYTFTAGGGPARECL